VRLSDTDRAAVAGGAIELVQPGALPLDDPDPPPELPKPDPDDPLDEPVPPEPLPKPDPPPPDMPVEHWLSHAAHATPPPELVAAVQLGSAALARHVCELALLALKAPPGQLQSR
jgi:hypothetical protein